MAYREPTDALIFKGKSLGRYDDPYGETGPDTWVVTPAQHAAIMAEFRAQVTSPPDEFGAYRDEFGRRFGGSFF